MTTNRYHTKGFTLVELTLVMAFMSILLLAILFLTLHAGKLYTKGLTNKTMNQISRDVADQMKRDFANVDASQILTPGELGTGDNKSGRLCTGQVSYLWNTAPLLNSGAPMIMADGSPITFRRVVDPTEQMCVQDEITDQYPMTIPATLKSTELLSSNGRDFAIYTMIVQKLATDNAKKGLFSVDMTLGTNEKSTTAKDATNGFQCLPPTDNTANFDYCTVEQMYTILRAGGGNS